MKHTYTKVTSRRT